jgi:hypothetical protein
MGPETAAASPELTGGAGFTFEDRVAAIYLTALIGESGAAGLRGDRVVAVELQRAAFGQPLDDLIVSATLQDGSSARLGLQVKRSLTVSAAESNTDFREVVAKAWATIKADDFRHEFDRVGVAAGSVADGPKRAAQAVFEWARLSPTADDFEARFGPGIANDRHRRTRDAFFAALQAADPAATQEDLRRLFASFQLITFDLLHEGATDEASAVSLLRTYLAPGDAGRADDVFVRLAHIAQESAGAAGQFSRPSLLARLRTRFKFTPAASFRGDLAKLEDEARLAIAEIDDSVEGHHIPRPRLADRVAEAQSKRRFVQISGLPGAGKSVVLRGLVEAALATGPVIFLKADRLQGKGWAGYAAALRLETPRLIDILLEVGAVGTATLFIDGLDRVEVEHRTIVNDHLNLLAQAPELAEWRVVATVRDNGLEPLRTWLSPRWLANGPVLVDVSVFDDAEAEALAQARPNLRGLLFGPRKLRELTRRPFHLSVIAHVPNPAAIASEVDLIEAWWRGGGYDAPDERVGDRQRALLNLAWEGARTLGRRMGVGAAPSAPLAELRSDGVIREVRSGHTVAFAHDIYFEWAFLHLLVDRGDAWPEVLSAVGEPPVLGRTVELLAQLYFREPPAWASHLAGLEGLGLRSQWTRAWMLGPFGSAGFEDQAAQMTAAAFDGDQPRLMKLAVWLQAEKTRPNPGIVQRAVGSDDVQGTLRIADQLAWPSDFEAWGRFIDWLVAHKGQIWAAATADVVSVFEVWQYAVAELPNPRSKAILHLVNEWLEDIEARRHQEDPRNYDMGRWSGMRGSLDELEKRLRALLLRAGKAYPELVRAYLGRVRAKEPLARAAFEEVLSYSRVLAGVLPAELSGYVLAQLLGELPDEAEARIAADPDRFMFGRGNNLFEWQQLSIERDGHFLGSPTPLQEPFHSLFQTAPDQARRLVAAICNHAIRAWRQLHGLGIDYSARPLPLVLNLPWGDQTFWGDDQVYTWFRGVWGPDATKGALMALERWAMAQLESGRPLDQVLQEALEGHESAGVLGIAVSMMLTARTPTSAGAAIVSSARLWKWDLARWQHDRGMNPNTIGMALSNDIEGRKALLASNALPIRQWSLRDLAMFFVLGADTPLAESVQAAIQAFKDNPPVDFQEQLDDPAQLADARRTGEIWSRRGDPANYEVKQTAAGDAVVIAHTNPHQNDPDVIEITERSRAMNDAAGLQLWANDCFKQNGVSDRMSLDEAVAVARRMDQPGLFEQAQEIGLGSMTRSGVAGVAAAALRFADLGEGDRVWARDVVDRAARTAESSTEPYIAQAAVPDHPCIFAARGLAALVAGGRDSSAAQETLLHLTLHPLEMVSASALGEAMACWPRNRTFAWTALDLGLRLSAGRQPEQPSPYGYDHGSNRTFMVEAYRAAYRRLERRKADYTLSSLPAAWERAPPDAGITSAGSRGPLGFLRAPFRRLKARLAHIAAPVLPARPAPAPAPGVGARSGRSRQSPRGTGWREPSVFLRWDFLPKVLIGIPIKEVLADPQYRPAFLGLCTQMLDWTRQRLVPPWLDGQPLNRAERRSSDLLEWRGQLGRFLGKVGLNLTAEEVRVRILAPVFALDDDQAFSLLAPLVSITSATGVLDPVEVAPSAFPTLEACAERMLASPEWASARRDGDLHGHHLPYMVRDVMFVSVLDTSVSARFANGDWREFDKIVPLIEKMTRAVGDVPVVAHAFLVACEHALPYVRPAWFAELALAIVSGHGRPVGWRGWALEGRLASVVQMVAEQAHPLDEGVAKSLLRVLDALVDMGARRAAALQISEVFKDVRVESAGRGVAAHAAST